MTATPVQIQLTTQPLNLSLLFLHHFDNSSVFLTVSGQFLGIILRSTPVFGAHWRHISITFIFLTPFLHFLVFPHFIFQSQRYSNLSFCHIGTITPTFLGQFPLPWLPWRMNPLHSHIPPKPHHLEPFDPNLTTWSLVFHAHYCNQP